MLYPLAVSDFLYRAALVYPDRIGVVDEPDQPAPSMGSVTYARMAELAAGQAATLDELGSRSAAGSRSCRTTRPGC